jgi:hypothetical protein
VKRLSFRLSQAVAGGRAAKAAPGSREVVLTRLLRKRAAAYRAGLDDQEQMLRDQILWSLPIDREPETADEASEAPKVEY